MRQSIGKRLVAWCQANNLFLNIRKMKKLVIDFRKWGGVYTPVYQWWSGLSNSFFGVNTTTNFPYSNQIDAMLKQVHQCYFFKKAVEIHHISNKSYQFIQIYHKKPNHIGICHNLVMASKCRVVTLPSPSRKPLALCTPSTIPTALGKQPTSSRTTQPCHPLFSPLLSSRRYESMFHQTQEDLL